VERVVALFTRRRAGLRVHAEARQDPTEPYAQRAIPISLAVSPSAITSFSDDKRGGGLPPFPRSLRIRLNEQECLQRRVRVRTATDFPCAVHGKSDADVLGVSAAPSIRTVHGCSQTPWLGDSRRTTPGRRLEDRRRETAWSRSAPTCPFCLRGRDTAKLLLVSATDSIEGPRTARTSRRNYMFHNSAAVLALSKDEKPDHLPEDAPD